MVTNVGDGSSHDSSLDLDRVSSKFQGPKIEAEKLLPSVVSGGGLTRGVSRRDTLHPLPPPHTNHWSPCILLPLAHLYDSGIYSIPVED